MWHADHWQGDKRYPFAQGIFPANTQTMGDGILHQLHQSTYYHWCWIAVGVGLGYIFVMNVAIVFLLKILPRGFILSLGTALSALVCAVSSVLDIV